MNRRPFGRTGAVVGEVGLGCWQLGGDWGTVEEETAFRILETAVEMGVNFWDTANVYGGGRSETLIGRFLTSPPGQRLCRHQAGARGDLPQRLYAGGGAPGD